jgi:hypothetical protein
VIEIANGNINKVLSAASFTLVADAIPSTTLCFLVHVGWHC